MPTKTTKKRYFAVGLIGWVQIRSANLPPVPLTTESFTMVKESKRKYIPGHVDGEPPNAIYVYGQYVDLPVVDKKLKMKSTIYQGGKVLRTMKTAVFSRLLGVSVKDGSMIELMPEQVKLLKERML